MKKRYIFSLAAMALLTAACSSDEMALNPADQPAPVEQKIPFTAVISADAAGTRALTEASDGKTITAKWEKEEKVALIHGEIIDVLEVSSVDATSGAATISGTITSPENDESVFVVYVGHQHVNMSNYVSRLQEIYTSYKADNPESSAIPTSIISEPVNELLATQDGTLETISNKHDFRFARSTFAVSDGTATFASEVKMPARYAIWKLNLTTDGTTALKAKKLVMKKDGEADVTIDLGNSTSSEFYVAFIVSPSTYSFEATDSDDKTYSCTPTVSALDGGKYYRSTLTMAAAATGNTYRVYTSGTAYTDEAIPSDAVTVTSTTTTWAAGTYLVSDEVTIASDVTLSGDVNLILKDGASLTITGGHIYGGADYENAGTYVLNLYGQAEGTGILTINDSEISGNPLVVKNLNIHGGEMTVTGGSDSQGIETFGSLTIYNGKVKTSGQYNGFMVCNDDMIVYGGDITAISTNGSALQVHNANLVISGGSVDATGGGGLEGVLCQKEEKGGTITISGGDVTAKGGAGGGRGLEGETTISGGTVTAIGGDGVAEDGKRNGGAGYDGTLTVTGGTFTATGGAKADEGSDGLGIYYDGYNNISLTLGTGIKYYEGDSANPDTVAASQTACTKRYVIIKPAE